MAKNKFKNTNILNENCEYRNKAGYLMNSFFIENFNVQLWRNMDKFGVNEALNCSIKVSFGFSRNKNKFMNKKTLQKSVNICNYFRNSVAKLLLVNDKTLKLLSVTEYMNESCTLCLYPMIRWKVKNFNYDHWNKSLPKIVL